MFFDNLLIQVPPKEFDQVLLAVAEAPLDLHQVEMEMRSWYISVMVKPVFRIRQEAFNSVDIVSTRGFAFFLMHDHVFSLNGQERIGLVAILEKAFRPCVLLD